jgi:putative peptide zinc metalloprotease protein
VRAVLPEGDALLIRGRVRRVDVREAVLGGIARPARALREMPAATNLLPSPALGDRAGGSFAIDPADKEGTRARDPVFLIDMTVPGLPEERIGNRVWVRFDLGYAPLATQVLRRVRQLFLRHFNPQDQT